MEIQKNTVLHQNPENHINGRIAIKWTKPKKKRGIQPVKEEETFLAILVA